MADGEGKSTEAAERYASAFFELARDANVLDAAARDVAALRGMLADSEDLRLLVGSPAFSADDKESALQALADKAGFDALIKQFLGVLAANRRAHELAGVLAAFDRLFAAHRGVKTAEVTSARPLSRAETDALTAALKAVVGGDIEVRPEVRPEILGGLVVKVGSRMFDSSLKTKLEGLKTAMKGA